MKIITIKRLLLIYILPLISVVTIQSQNFVTTYAGTGTPGFVNGDTSVASFNRPFGITIDPEGNLYLADAYNHCIRKIGIDGQVSVFAGAGQAGYADGTALEAKFNQPLNLCFDIDGNMYVSDFINQRIRKISPDMQVTTIAGTGLAGYSDGPALLAQFNYPRGICVDDTGNIYVGDSWNHRVRRISADGSVVTTWAGGGDTIGVQSVGGYKDASDTSARFYTPCELSMDQYGNIFVADAYNHRIRKVDPYRMVTTVAGSGGHGPDGGGFQDGPNDAAQFDVPTACFVMMDGRIFVGDGANQRVRFIGPDMVSTFAGSGETGFEDGSDSLATFNFPRGSVFDYERNRLYVVDYNNHAVRIIHVEDDITALPEVTKDLEFDVYPNPLRDKVAFQYDIEKLSRVEIVIFDHLGKRVEGVYDRMSSQGKHKVNVNLGHLPPGIYLCVLRTDAVTKTKKIIKVD